MLVEGILGPFTPVLSFHKVLGLYRRHSDDGSCRLAVAI